MRRPAAARECRRAAASSMPTRNHGNTKHGKHSIHWDSKKTCSPVSVLLRFRGCIHVPATRHRSHSFCPAASPRPRRKRTGLSTTSYCARRTINPLLDLGPDVSAENVVVAGAGHHHQALRSGQCVEDALRVDETRVGIGEAVNHEYRHGDAGRGQQRARRVNRESTVMFRAANAAAIARSEKNDGARSIAMLRKSANVEAATTALTRGSPAAACNATAAPSECPISTASFTPSVINHATEVLLFEDAVACSDCRSRRHGRGCRRRSRRTRAVRSARRRRPRCRDCRRCHVGRRSCRGVGSSGASPAAQLDVDAVERLLDAAVRHRPRHHRA